MGVKFQLRCLLALVAAFAAPASAHASTILVQSPSFDPLGFRWGTVIYAPAGVSTTMRMGRNQLSGIDPSTGLPKTFFSYALDVLTPLQSGDFQLQSLAGLVPSVVKLNQIKALVEHGDPIATSANRSAAIQMAVWEILYEQGTTGYNVATGQFRVRGGDSGTARTLANSYLNNVQSLVWIPTKAQRFASLTSISNQSQLIRDAVIPEPGTWAMLITGFVGVGAALRRQRRRAVLA